MRVAPTDLYQLFQQTAAAYPQRIAVDVPPRRPGEARVQWSYAELDARARVVADALGVTGSSEAVVLIRLARRDPWLFAAQLGALRAGAAFTCPDEHHPPPHVRRMIDQAGVVAVVTSGSYANEFDDLAQPVLCHERLPAPVDERTSSAALASRHGPDRLAYVVFTSGTTGMPKGVAVEHRSALRLILDDRDHFGFTPDDRIAQGSSPAYDSSLEESWAAFASGGTVVVLDAETARLGPDLVDWLRAERITVLMPPPTLLRTLGPIDPARELPDLRLVYAGGEAMPQDLADRFGAALWLENGYGPTECTVTCLRGRLYPGEAVHIGQPVAGAFAEVLDEQLQPVAVGESGELCMGGECLARGYLGDPQRTAERFVTLGDGRRVYRTGDLVAQREDGRFLYQGRIDQQVKVRGHRVELEAVEAALAAQEGVLEAACRLQGDGPSAQLVGFVVASNPASPPLGAELRETLAGDLPAPWVPSAVAVLDVLPKSVGGKLDRRRLPDIGAVLSGASGASSDTAGDPAGDAAAAVPSTPHEVAIAAAAAGVLGAASALDVTADLFDLGADSVRAAELVSRLREDAATAALTVRDVYERRSVRGLATVLEEAAARRESAGSERIEPRAVDARRVEVEGGKDEGGEADSGGAEGRAGSGAPIRPLFVTALQAAVLVSFLLITTTVAWLGWFELLPWLIEHASVTALVCLAPFARPLLTLSWTPLGVLLTLFAKRTLVGRYRPGCLPVWSLPWFRHWVVMRIARTVPFGLLSGTVFVSAVLRSLGARVGSRVFIHRGVDLAEGGWDLLRIDDDAVLGRDSRVAVSAISQGALHLAPVHVGQGAVVETRAGLEGGSSLGEGSVLRALSHLPAKTTTGVRESWDGVPAQRVGAVSDTPGEAQLGRRLSPALHGLMLIGLRTVAGGLASVPGALVVAFVLEQLDISDDAVQRWVLDPWAQPQVVALFAALAILSLVFGLLGNALLLRLTPKVRAGTHHLFGTSSICASLRVGILERAGAWLSGAVFWPWWLRLAGMRVGAGCEISTISDVLPEQVRVGAGSFFADGIYLGGAEPRGDGVRGDGVRGDGVRGDGVRGDGVRGGVLRVGPLELGSGTFLGNHAVLRPNTDLAGDVLLGVCTVADPVRMTAGTSWFGHPPFQLPRREVIEADASLTHRPSLIRRVNRVFWELLRFGLPAAQLMLALGWVSSLAAVLASTPGQVETIGLVAAVGFAWSAVAALGILVLKWSLLGRVRPGQHVLWSCWCSRWDFVYVAWQRLAAAPLAALQQTLLLAPYLRLMGMRIGRRVVLGRGFAQVVDPDMLEFEDGATVDGLFQAHSFEDRVLKIDRVRIAKGASLRSGAVVLYGAELGERSVVEPHSVVMKQERLVRSMRHVGVPTRAAGEV